MFGRFLKNYGKTKIMDGVQGLNDAIVSWDPEGATEAAIAEMEENFDEINKQYSQAKSVWEKEDREAREIVAVRDQRMAAAEALSAARPGSRGGGSPRASLSACGAGGGGAVGSISPACCHRMNPSS